MALLRIDGLSKTFLLHRVNRRVQGCQDIDFAIEPGQFVGITGRSGSGKSTILRCIWRTNLPERGRILYDSQRFGMLDLAQATQRQMLYLRTYELGYVSQFLNALPRQTAYDIVLKSALEAYGADERSRAEEETERMLRHFDLDEGLWELCPRTFSGGEKLRLNIAAAMIKRPRLLLLDEPTASLDNASKLKVRSLIEQLKAEGTTMLGIFHDLEFMEGLCDHEFNMQEGMMAGRGCIARARRRAVASRKGWRARERMFHVKHPEAATEPLAAATFVATAPCAVAQRRPNGKKHSNSESRAVFSRRRKAERWQNAWSWKTMPRLLA